MKRCKIESSSHPDIDHQLPIFGTKCYVLMPWIQSMRHAEQPVPSSLPEISMFWPSTTEPSGPGGWHFGALTKSKKITSPEHTSRNCLLIRFRLIVPRNVPQLFHELFHLFSTFFPPFFHRFSTLFSTVFPPFFHPFFHRFFHLFSTFFPTFGYRHFP